MLIHVSNKIEIRREENPGFNPAGPVRRWTFPNPKFYENVRLGFSNFGTPESLCLAELDDQTLFLPRGAAADILSLCPRAEVVDETVTAPSGFEPASFILRDYQNDALESLTKKNQGVLQAPPGSGKTVAMLELIIRRGQKTLILVHTKDLLEQWRDRMLSFTTIKPGIIQGGTFYVQPVTIATVQSLNRPLPEDFKNGFGMVILDECHHCPASSFKAVVNQFPARYRYGCTATPDRQDGLGFLLTAVIGPILHKIENSALVDSGDILRPVIKTVETFSYYPVVESYGELLNRIVEDEQRNHLIVDLIGREAAEGNSCLVLSERVRHVRILHDLFRNKFQGIGSFAITGKDSKEHRQAAVAEMNAGNAKVLFATRLADEGLDIRRLNRLFLTCPVRAVNKLTQQIGRIQRTFPGKTDAIVYDFIDSNSLAKNQSYTRKKLYEKFNYPEQPHETTNIEEAIFRS
jgi:superfamily II DNA or RNA helicase